MPDERWVFVRRDYLIALGIFVVVGVVLFAALTLVVDASQAAPAPAASGDLDAATLQVAKGLYCPVCPGTPLDVCETQACQQWRALIKEKLAAGETPSQIEAYFVQQYGERVLGAPRAQGLNTLVYAIPAFAVSAGAALLFLLAQRRVKPTPAALDAANTPADEYRDRIQRELNEND